MGFQSSDSGVPLQSLSSQDASAQSHTMKLHFSSLTLFLQCQQHGHPRIRRPRIRNSWAVREVAALASGAAVQDLGAKDVHGTVKVGSEDAARLELVMDLGATNALSFT